MRVSNATIMAARAIHKEDDVVSDMIAWLLATFVITPLQAEVADKLQSVEASAGIVQQVQTCVTGGTSALIARSANEPWWAIRTVVSVSVGLADAQSVLAETSPECAAAMAALTPLLADPEV